MRRISNSEASTWMHCKRQYYYEYLLDLEPKQFSGPLAKGILVHNVLEQYYLEKMDGSDEQQCRNAAYAVLSAEAGNPESDIAEILKIKAWVEGYFDKYAEADEQRYEVIGVETEFNIPLTEDFSLVGRVDALFLDKEDGRFVAVDHKTSYNFWSEDQLQVSGQFVKYTAGLRDRGFDVKAFMVNQLRTRELKPGNEIYRRAFVRPTDRRLRAVLDQHIRVGQEIVDFRAAADYAPNPKELAYPIFDKHGCANCSFFALCDSDTEGAPTEHLIAQNYQVKKFYGYNKEEPMPITNDATNLDGV